MDGDKKPLISSTRMLNITAADHVGIMNLIINAKLKQNSKLVVHNIRSNTSSSSKVFWETRLFDHTVQRERTRLFLYPGDSTITEWVHKLPMVERQNTLFSTAALEGGYSNKRLVTSLYWQQDIRVQTVHTNIKQWFTTQSDKRVAPPLSFAGLMTPVTGMVRRSVDPRRTYIILLMPKVSYLEATRHFYRIFSFHHETSLVLKGNSLPLMVFLHEATIN